MTANLTSHFPSFPPQPAAAAAVAPAKLTGKSPLEQLLHALNQPLTGLQCSMEVALASPRTAEQYVRGLREGLELTDRMRALVGAIREVTDMGEKPNTVPIHEEWPVADLTAMLRTTLDDLAPVAEVKSVRVEFTGNGTGPRVPATAKRQRLETAVFRLLESALGSAAPGSVLCVEVGEARGTNIADWLRARWQAGWPPSAAWRAEIGLLVSQAAFEQLGGRWDRQRSGEVETVTIQLRSTAA